jgi:peptide/bleomycin uptake transporter
VTGLAPLLMVGPGMFTGAVTFGLLNQVSDAYSRVDNAFGLILNNWTTLTELRSIWKRLHEFEANLDQLNTGSDVGRPEAAEALPA